MMNMIESRHWLRLKRIAAEYYLETKGKQLYDFMIKHDAYLEEIEYQDVINILNEAPILKNGNPPSKYFIYSKLKKHITTKDIMSKKYIKTFFKYLSERLSIKQKINIKDIQYIDRKTKRKVLS